MAARLDGLHPTFVDRLDRFLADPDIAGRFTIGSGVRTREEQARLYNGWRRRLPGFNLAANPDRVMGTTAEGWVAKGSWHMIQGDGHGYAVDLSKPWTMTRTTARAIVDRVAPRYGLRRTVPSEFWHIQPRNLAGWFPDPSEPASPPPQPPGVQEDDDMPIQIAYDSKVEKWRVFVTGEGSTLVDEPKHWVEVIAAARETGLPVSSPWLEVLVYKIRVERAGGSVSSDAARP